MQRFKNKFMSLLTATLMVVVPMLSVFYSPTPVLAAGVTPMVAGGDSSGYALKTDGTVWSWGYNGSGQLGNGTASNSSVPVQVGKLGGDTRIAGGDASGY